MTKEIVILAKVMDSGRVAFKIERNGEGATRDILELIGVLQLIIKSQLETIGELNKV